MRKPRDRFIDLGIQVFLFVHSLTAARSMEGRRRDKHTLYTRYICVSHGSVSKANITPYIGLSSVLMSVRRSINYLTMIHIHILCNHLYTGELPPQLRFSERVPTCWDWETDSLLQPDDMDKKCNDFESLYVLHVRFYWCCINSI